MTPLSQNTRASIMSSVVLPLQSVRTPKSSPPLPSSRGGMIGVTPIGASSPAASSFAKPTDFATGSAGLAAIFDGGAPPTVDTRNATAAQAGSANVIKRLEIPKHDIEVLHPEPNNVSAGSRSLTTYER